MLHRLETSEDILDYSMGIQALEEFEKNPICHAIDEVIKDLEISNREV